MEPYQQAAQEVRRQGELPLKIAGNALALGTTLGTTAIAGSTLGRVLPFLSQYIPEDLAIKGLNKIDPRFGNFIKKAMDAGQSFEEVRDFIGGKAQEAIPAQADKNTNLIEKHSPELHEFLLNEIKKGTPPAGAAGIALLPRSGKNFKSIIDKITKEHKANWGDIVESIYGGQQHQQKQNAPAISRDEQSGFDFMGAPSGQYQRTSRPPTAQQGVFQSAPAQQAPQLGQTQQGQVGPGQQAFMALLQKINQRLGQ